MTLTVTIFSWRHKIISINLLLLFLLRH